ncbi:peptidase S8/S53 domain-containing protein [Xylariales sp. PMI_506]|nr:peptidase S8/S53 domain-containing protein [Xylariales sp. PMI_506]
MKLSPFITLVAGGLAGLGSATTLRRRNFDVNDYYVVHLDKGTQPELIAARLGLTHEGPLGELADHYIFSGSKQDDDLVRTELKERKRKRSLGGVDLLDSVQFAQKQKLHAPLQKRVVPPKPAGFYPLEPRQEADANAVIRQQEVMTKLGISDPIFNEQWHLFNPVQVGHDVNVVDVWLSGITGKNATVAIVDDGLDMHSNDLKPNYYALGSYDFNDHDAEPAPELADDRHGTRCAGEVSAAKNDVCGVGVAYDSKIAGIRILSKMISDADEALAMNYDFQHNQIYSCSWGPPDDGRTMDAPGVLIRRAMLNGIQNGREGLGSIYVFASGNGAASDDNCNFDGYTNSIYSITVGAVDRKGGHPYYSEKCSAQLVVTYSSGAGDAIHTTDVGENTCSDAHGGTSAAAPLAAGIFALALEIRPDLSWRDMQYIAIESAVPIDLDTEEWQTTSIGKQFSHTFGYGKIDSYKLVEVAKTWKNVNPQAWYFSPWIHVHKEIPQGNEGLAVTFDVTADMLKEANVATLEHVTVTMNVEHKRRGDLSVDLISPDGIVSHIATARKLDNSASGYNDWTFMSVLHWGEKGIGTWTIIVRDTKVDTNNGTFIDAHLKLWGAAIDPAKATVLPMPSDDDDKDHDVVATTTQIPSTVTLPPHPTNTDVLEPSELPTDHPSRPSKKPGDTAADTSESAAATSSAASSWLPSFLPTFGASRNTMAWIYGSVGLIVLFMAGLGIWWWVVRRRRLRNNPRDEYDFELLAEDEGEGLTGNGEKAGNKKRGGELYDAFAGGSDDEEEAFRDEVVRNERISLDDDDEEDAETDARNKDSTRLLGNNR